MKWQKLVQAPYLFVFLAFIFGTTFAIILPPLWGLDEITHFNRAYQISTGNFFEDKLPNGTYGGNVPSNIVDLSGYTYLDLVDSQHIDNLSKTKSFEIQKISPVTRQYDFTGSAAYPPFVYAVPAAAIWAARELHASLGVIIFIARLATLTFYTGLVFIALWLLRDKRAMWLVFTVALLPMALSQAVTISADSLVIGLSLLLFSLLVTYWERRRKIDNWVVWATVAVSVILALIKPVYLTITLLPVFFLGQQKTVRKKLSLGLVLALILAIPALLWVLFVHGLVHTGTAGQLGEKSQLVHPKAQLLFIAEHPLKFVHDIVSNSVLQDWYGQTWGQLGWNYVKIPSAIRSLLLAALILIALWIKPAPAKEKSAAYIYVISAVATVVGLITFFYLIFNAVGTPLISGVQGRYFIPALPFLFYGAGRLIPSIKVVMSPTTASFIFPTVSTICLIASTLVYFSATYI
jgi:uncharacterized membrane protein